jgi:beta-lactamase class A
MLKRIFSAFVVLLIASTLSSTAQNELPLPSSTIQPISEIDNGPLQVFLEQEIENQPYWKQLASQKRLAVGIIDLNDPDFVQYAGINSEEMMYAASLPKIAVLLAAMDAIDKCELIPTPEVRSDMKLMISKSNNQATTRMIDRVGFKKISDILTDPKYNLYDREKGGLWVGKRYAAQGNRVPDPIKGLSHAASVKQVCRFYYKLVTGNLVNKERSQEMLDIMENPALHHKFVNTLDRIAPNARLFRKSGSWRNFHSDSILVWGEDGRKYILVALVDDPNGEQIIRNLVVPVEKIIKKLRSFENS